MANILIIDDQPNLEELLAEDLADEGTNWLMERTRSDGIQF